MISTSERLKALKKFQPIQIKEIEFLGKIHNLIYSPSLGLFRIIPVDGNVEFVSFAISKDYLTSKTHRAASKNDKAELMAQEARFAWLKLSAKKRRDITNKMPLNSLFLGGDTIY